MMTYAFDPDYDELEDDDVIDVTEPGDVDSEEDDSDADEMGSFEEPEW